MSDNEDNGATNSASADVLAPPPAPPRSPRIMAC